MMLQGSQILTIDLKSGVTKEGKPWEMMRYKVTMPEGGPRWMSCFGKYNPNTEKFEHPAINPGDIVNISYTEKPNPLNPQFPYSNIHNIERVDEDKEQRKLFNIVEPGAAPQPQETGSPPVPVPKVVAPKEPEFGEQIEVEEMDMNNIKADKKYTTAPPTEMIAGGDADEDAERGMYDLGTEPKKVDPVADVEDLYEL